MEKLISEFSVGLFFWQTILFVALILLLRKYAWKPILSAVEEREKNISEAVEQAQRAREEMARLKSSNEDLLKQAREERDNILKEANQVKEQIISEAKNKAKEEAEKIIAASRLVIQNEKMAALTELKNQVAVLSIEIAEKILRNELSKDDKQKQLANTLADEINLN
jgi:F-type H+-transporting ATPase subunit b